MHMGRLYRPAQDCSEVYGQRIVINEVLALSPADFEERSIEVPGLETKVTSGAFEQFSSFADKSLNVLCLGKYGGHARSDGFFL